MERSPSSENCKGCYLFYNGCIVGGSFSEFHDRFVTRYRITNREYPPSNCPNGYTREQVETIHSQRELILTQSKQL